MSTVSLRLRALGALGVLVLFPFFILFLFALILVVGVWVAMKVPGSAGTHILVLVIPLGLALRAAFRDVRKARKQQPVPGHELTRAEHPALWAELDESATAMQQPRPDRVVVLPTVNAFVTTAAGPREVMIGYPLLAGLNRAQLRSVLAHEMGHLAHGHTKSGGLTYRAGRVLDRTVTRLEPGLIRALVSGYYHFYLLFSMSVMRDHERQADDWSAKLAGGPEAASVFPELARLDAVWGLLVDRYLPLAAESDTRPPLDQAIHELSQGHKSELDQFVAQQISRRPSRWSTHPADAERMRRLQSSQPAATFAPTAEQAWQLLGRQTPGPLDPRLARTALTEVEAALLPDDSTPAGWDQVVDQALLGTARRHLGYVLDQFVAQVPDRTATLRNLILTLGTGAQSTAGALISPMLRGDVPPHQRQRVLESSVAEAVDSALLVGLSDQGRARTALRWDGPAEREYLEATGEVVPWPETFSLTLPMNAEQADRILERLVRDGVDIDATLITDPAESLPASGAGSSGASSTSARSTGSGSTGNASTGGPNRPRTLGSVTAGGVAAVSVRPRRAGAGRRNLHDVLVMDDGLLISQIPGRPFGFGAAMQAQYLPAPLRRKAAERIQQLAREVAGQPGSWSENRPEAVWVPYPSVQHAVLKDPVLSTKQLSLDLDDGTSLLMKWSKYSSEIGDVDPVLTSALHGKF